MPPCLYILRHGHIDTAGCLVGQTDLPLSPKGIKQAHNWRDRLSGIAFGAVWCSPLQRAKQMASLVSAGKAGVQIQPVDALKEVSLGLWEGMPKEEVQARYPHQWERRGQDMAHCAPPGGESLAMLAHRVLPAFHAIYEQAEQHEHSLLVAHRSVIQAILAHILALPVEMMPSIHLPYASLVCLDQCYLEAAPPER